MNLALSEEQLSVREAFAELFHAESPPARVRAAEVAGFDERLWRLYAGTRALGTGVPPELGGGGCGLLDRGGAPPRSASVRGSRCRRRR